jgi:DNA invertase Pin-like site-specific DNA recombinase
MFFGYINETIDFPQETQYNSLIQASCKNIYIEIKEGKIKSEELYKLLCLVKKNDSIIIYSIFILPVTTLELIRIIDDLYLKNIKFESLKESLGDGELFTVLAAHLRYTRKKRITKGLEAAKARGRKGGRKPGLSPEARKTAELVAKLYNSGESVEDIRKSLAIGSKVTIYRYLRFAGIDI